nr:uncharacterized protein LOC111421710 [Onthophagus taurus]
MRGKEAKTINIKGMTSAAEIKEVEEAIRNTVGQEIEFKTSNLRPYARYMKAITVEMEKTAADQMLNEKKVRVGLTMCQVEERKGLKKCSRCWSPTHLARDCCGEDRSTWCFNCGGQDHKAKDCKSEARCSDCKRVGHRASTNMCPEYRNKMKGGKEETLEECPTNERDESKEEESEGEKRENEKNQPKEGEEEEIKFTEVTRKKKQARKDEKKGRQSPTDASLLK